MYHAILEKIVRKQTGISIHTIRLQKQKYRESFLQTFYHNIASK